MADKPKIKIEDDGALRERLCCFVKKRGGKRCVNGR